jgi:hypothetical protein
MNLFAFALLLIVLLLTSAYVAMPLLLQARERRQPAADHERSALMADYERTLIALQELDFDNNLGKIPAEDYPPMRMALLQKGTQLLHKIDELQGKAKSAQGEDHLEAVIAERRAKKGSAAEPSDDDIESLVAARRKARPQKAGGFCPKCGKAVLSADRFCPSCGKAL